MLETNLNFRLAECEAKVTAGLRSFYEAGKALFEIRENELYKSAGYSAFDEYCQVKWMFTRAYAYRLISAFSVVSELEEGLITKIVSPIGDTINNPVMPLTENQARHLSKLETPELRKEVWEKVVRETGERNEPITAKKVEDAVREYCKPCENAMTFRKITYLTPYYHKRFEILKRGEKESEFLRGIVEAFCDNFKN